MHALGTIKRQERVPQIKSHALLAVDDARAALALVRAASAFYRAANVSDLEASADYLAEKIAEALK